MTQAAKGKVGGDVAKPYEPTTQEALALARHNKRRSASPNLPGFTCDVSKPNKAGVREAKMSIDHPDTETGYRIISDAFGSGDRNFVCGILKDATGLAISSDGMPDMERANYAASIVKGIKPRDEVETMLAAQMAAIQIATMRIATFLAASKRAENINVYERSLNRLSRTFVAQVEGLKRYRSKGEQRVIVERVNVESGGQAIVGDVQHRGGGGRCDDETQG